MNVISKRQRGIAALIFLILASTVPVVAQTEEQCKRDYEKTVQDGKDYCNRLGELKNSCLTGGQVNVEKIAKYYLDECLTRVKDVKERTIAKTVFKEHKPGAITPSDLISILNQASDKAWKPDLNADGKPFPKGGRHAEMSLNCSEFFRQVMRLIQQRGLTGNLDFTDNDCDANCLIKRIGSSRDWAQAPEAKVQELANAGVLVVGVAPYLDGHGHIAFVSPIPEGLEISDFPGEGPFIRDGNEHTNNAEDRLYASSWGAIKASKAFNYRGSPPKWYVWTVTMR